MARNGSGFSRADYERFMHPDTHHAGYGELEWAVDGAKASGSFSIASDMENVEMLVVLNEMRIDEPTFLVRLNKLHLARIDVNGRHRFADGVRASTHLQSNPNGSGTPEITTELHAYPSLSFPGYPDFDTQLAGCFRMSEPHLRISLDGVIWTPNPFEGGA